MKWSRHAKHAISHRARAFASSSPPASASHGPMNAQASASTCTGRSAPPSAPTATSTAMCGRAASTRRASSRAFLRELAHWADARARPHRGQHLLRRRHAVADGGGHGRRHPRCDRAALDGRARRRDHAGGQPVERGGRRAFAAIARPASTASRSACSRSTMLQLRALGRLHTATEARPAIEVARETFERFSFDLIYARPGQTMEAWRAELGQALALGRAASVALPAHHRGRHAVRASCTRAASSRFPMATRRAPSTS